MQPPIGRGCATRILARTVAAVPSDEVSLRREKTDEFVDKAAEADSHSLM